MASPRIVTRRSVLYLSPAWLFVPTAFACASGPLSSTFVRSDAAARLNCPEQSLTSEDYGPRTARISGCGRSLTYVCQQAQGPEAQPRSPVLTEEEARNTPSGQAGCTWVVAK